MGRIRNNNYFVINGWMVNELGLTGRELQVYAIIYGFTQDGESEFSGSLNYIAEWLGTSSHNTVLRSINNLIDMGLITKRQETKNKVTTNFYRAVITEEIKQYEARQPVKSILQFAALLFKNPAIMQAFRSWYQERQKKGGVNHASD